MSDRDTTALKMADKGTATSNPGQKYIQSMHSIL